MAWRHRQQQGPSAKRGRPTIEKSTDTNIVAAIIDYFESNASTDGKRRTECLEAGIGLNELQKILLDKYEMEVKRSTLYTRLLPRNYLTAEGKRHHTGSFCRN
jgi:hypothetical protein